MKEIKLSDYDVTISSEELGKSILESIKESLANNDKISLDFGGIDAITTFCAKQIFGYLYIELGEEQFYKRIGFFNVPEDIQFIITRSIYDAIEDSNI